jgi:hypothetical protein
VGHVPARHRGRPGLEDDGVVIWGYVHAGPCSSSRVRRQQQQQGEACQVWKMIGLSSGDVYILGPAAAAM